MLTDLKFKVKVLPMGADNKNMTTIKQQIEAVKTYEDFAKLYEMYLRDLLKQKLETVGVSICAEQLADLTDAFPEFEARYDAENN